MSNPLKRLAELGQAVWLDYIRRDLYEGPALRRLITEDGLTGITSNPTIFQKAISETTLYDGYIGSLAAQGMDSSAILEAVMIRDVRGAADVLRSVYDRTAGDDGFVSIEVPPEVAGDTEATIGAARRLWTQVDRPNVMIKIPATDAGIGAIQRCLAEGIHVNITLLFSVERYRQVINAYVSAMEERVESKQPIAHIRSVASFFISRVDSNVDPKLHALAKDSSRSESDRRLARELTGKVAIANARLAYQEFENSFRSARFEKLRRSGARIQRPLWASTSAKDPSYPPLYYVESLVAPDSIDTMPPQTVDAYRVFGDPRIRIHDHLDVAQSIFPQLEDLGISVRQIWDELEAEGAEKFSNSVTDVLRTIDQKTHALMAGAGGSGGTRSCR